MVRPRGVRPRTDAARARACQRSPAVQPYTSEPPIVCERCGDVIGIYEPTIVVDGEPRETSRAAEPELARLPGERYHRDCFADR